jgi:hypothetical protein
MEVLDYETYAKDFEDYYENVVKKETANQSKQKLIQSGVLNKRGEKIERHGVKW